PLSVVFGETTYQEEIDITTEEFYEKIKESAELPKTSQPSIGYITEKLEELAKDYDAVISVHLSSGISGTYQAVGSAGEMVEGIKVYPYDSEMSCAAHFRIIRVYFNSFHHFTCTAYRLIGSAGE